MNIKDIMASLEAKHPGEPEYLQAVHEVLLSIEETYNEHPEFEKAKIIERLVEPDRIFTFKVPWSPCSVSVSSSFHFLSGKDYLYSFSGISPSKDGNLCVLLQHHVITEDQRHPYIGFHLCQPKAYGQQEYP